MPPLALTSLPPDILLLVCQFLDYTHPRSVPTFALCSKACAAIANVQLYRSISLSVNNSIDLPRDVDTLQAALSRIQGHRYVKNLVLVGFGPIDARREQDACPYSWHTQALARPRSLTRLNEDMAGYHPQIDFYSGTESSKHVYDMDKAWHPLAALLQSLPALSDLFYECSTQFPPCMLTILHESKPGCRLHLNTFYLRSLKNEPSLDPYELKLATSPSLHSIRSNGYIQSIVSLVVRAATNLKHVHVQHPHHFDLVSKNWRDDSDPGVFRQASLESLTITKAHFTSQGEIEAWRTCTDFSTLRALKLLPWLTEGALRVLAESCDFRNLQTLALQLYTETDVEACARWVQLAERFLLNIPHLTSLRLEGQLEKCRLGQIVAHYGKHLRCLSLIHSLDDYGPFDTSRYLQSLGLIRVLAKSCPNLEDLTLPIRRSRGGESEVASYKSLGAIFNLHTLSLTLDASDYAIAMTWENEEEPPNDASFDSFDQEIFDDLDPYGMGTGAAECRNGHIRDAFINSALDEDLARSIFAAISSGKPPSSRPLESLKIGTKHGADFGRYQMTAAVERVINNLSRSWVLERSCRDDCRETIIAKDVTPKSQVESTDLIGVVPEEDDGPGVLYVCVEPIFRRLWPATEEHGGDWREEWHSFPLATMNV